MTEKILWESSIPSEIKMDINEEGPEANHGGTTTSDIASTAPSLKAIQPTVAISIPEMLGFIQNINAPQGYIFGMTERKKTAIVGSTIPTTGRPDGTGVITPDAPAPTNMIITRKLVETEIRDVEISLTNEAFQDINALFGQGIGKNSDDVKEDPLGKYFTDFGKWQLINKINDDFMTFLAAEATNKGTCAIATIDDMPRLFQAFGEMRESLFKATGKSGRTFAVVSPRIASFLTSTVGAVSANQATWFEDGRITPNTKINSYVCTLGDMDVYQYSFVNNTLGGTMPTTMTGKIYMGISGENAGSASIYYSLYKDYIVKGGSDAYNNQSSVFFRRRDAFSTNPMDTYAQDQTITDNTDKQGTNSSAFLVYCDVTFGESVIS